MCFLGIKVRERSAGASYESSLDARGDTYQFRDDTKRIIRKLKICARKSSYCEYNELVNAIDKARFNLT